MSEIFARQFYNAVLDREEISAARLDQIMRIEEGQFHEFKSGPTPDKPAAAVLREYLAGFANAEGGLLLMGVSDAVPRSPTETRNWLTTDPKAWAVSATRDLLPFLSSPPVFGVVEHSGKKVLLAAVDRASLLVPCLESGQNVYYYRSGDSTFPMRESLIADLILGRRRGPLITVSSAYIDLTNASGFGSLSFGLILDNESFAFSDELSAGVVTCGLDPVSGSPNAELLRSVELVARPSWSGMPWKPYFLRRSARDYENDVIVRPFATGMQIRLQGNVRVPWQPAKVRYGAFVAPRDGPPQWFQCDLDWRPDTTRRTQRAVCERLFRSRPIIDWLVQT